MVGFLPEIMRIRLQRPSSLKGVQLPSLVHRCHYAAIIDDGMSILPFRRVNRLFFKSKLMAWCEKRA